MDDLVEWLRAQLDLDQAWAQSLPEQPGSEIYNGEQWVPAPARDRMLREVEAKRRLIDRLTVQGRPRYQIRDTMTGTTMTGQELITLLALPFSVRPGYREEWRP